ncbi:MAG: DUF6318 family protein [Nocardioides sp.]
MTGTRAVIAAVVLTLGLAGCSGEDPEPNLAPSASTSPTSPAPTPSPSGPVAPTMPEAAKGTDAAAAEAFVKFYWDTVNYAQKTGDVDGLRDLSSTRCIACQAGIDYLDDVFANDGEISGGASQVGKLKTAFVDDGDALDAVVEFELSTSRQRVDYPGRALDEVYRGGTSSMRARLEPTQTAWKMLYWDEA